MRDSVMVEQSSPMELDLETGCSRQLPQIVCRATDIIEALCKGLGHVVTYRVFDPLQVRGSALIYIPSAISGFSGNRSIGWAICP